jgi:hypothetical protein
MGKSALPIVASQQEVVYPSKGVPLQPAYVRGKHSIQTSSRLKSFQACVAAKLAGSHPGSRMAVRDALKGAAQSCRGGGR